MITLGVDIGGTYARAACVDSTGRILKKYRTPTPNTFGKLMDWLNQAVGQLRSADVSQAAIALPGLVDRKLGGLVRSTSLPFLEGVLLTETLMKSCGLAVSVLTDADAATWGEYCRWTQSNMKSVAGPSSFLHLRVGTGIACGFVKEGSLVALEPGRSGHLELLVVDRSDNAVLCVCGKRGCLEAIASGRVLAQRTKAAGYAGGVSEMRRAYELGEPSVRRIIDQAVDALATGLVNVTTQLCPDVICVGGGVTQHCNVLLTQVLDLWGLLTRNRGQSSIVPPPVLYPAQLGDDAGVVGAAFSVMRFMDAGRLVNLC